MSPTRLTSPICLIRYGFERDCNPGIQASEKMWKRNRKAAVIFAGLVNAAMAAVVANNYRTVVR